MRVERSVSLNDYAKLFDFDWAKEFDARASGTEIENASRALLSTWRGIGNTFRMPFVMVELMHAFAKTYTDDESYLHGICAQLANELGRRMEEKLSQNKAKQLEREMKKIAAAVPPKVRPETFSAGKLWERILEEKEVRLIQWSAQQQCFTNLYFAYDHFMVECLCCQLKDRDIELYANRAEKLFTSAFDTPTYEFCSNDHDVIVARLCRNDLAHNGGFETDRLRSKGHSFRVIDGRLCILPHDNRTLFDRLTVSVHQSHN